MEEKIINAKQKYDKFEYYYKIIFDINQKYDKIIFDDPLFLQDNTKKNICEMRKYIEDISSELFTQIDEEIYKNTLWFFHSKILKFDLEIKKKICSLIFI